MRTSLQYVPSGILGESDEGDQRSRSSSSFLRRERLRFSSERAMSPSEGPLKRNWSVWRPHVVYTFMVGEAGCLRVGSEMVGMATSERVIWHESLVLVCMSGGQ